MKFSKANKMAILILLGIGIAGFILGFISPRITLFNSEAAGWGKPQANIENKEVQMDVYDIFFVEYQKDVDVDWTEKEESVNLITLKILLNISNPFEDTGLIIPRLDIKLGNLEKPVGRAWTTERFELEPFDVNPDTQGDSIELQLEKRNSTNSAGLWTIYLSLYTGADSGLNFFINDLFKGNLGTLFFDATLELGNYPINVEGLFGEALKLVGLGLGGTESGAITDESIPELLANALGADLDRIAVAIRSDSIFLSEIEFRDIANYESYHDIRALSEETNTTIFRDKIEAKTMNLVTKEQRINNQTLYFGKDKKFNSLYLPNAKAGFDNKTRRDHLQKNIEYIKKNMTDAQKELSIPANGSMRPFVEKNNILFNMTELPFKADYLLNYTYQQIVKDIHLNNAVGNGTYIWEYWNGVKWIGFNNDIVNDTTSNFGYQNSVDHTAPSWQTGYINFDSDALTGWAKNQIYDRFSSDYYFIRCRNGTNLDSALLNGGNIKIDIKHSRIGKADIPNEEPEPEDSTVFSDGGIQIDNSVIMAEEEEPKIIYPGIDPSNLPNKALNQTGIIQYGGGEFDEYLSDVILKGKDLLQDLVGPNILTPLDEEGNPDGGIIEALKLYANEPDLLFFDSDSIGGVQELDLGRVFFNLFTALYAHNISTADFLIKSQLNMGNLLDLVAEAMVENAPNDFTHESMWVEEIDGKPVTKKWANSNWSDSDAIYSWVEQENFKSANFNSMLLFGILGAVAIISIPYNIIKKEDQSKFLTGADISNAKDLMEDDTGKTVLIGSVSSSDSQKVRYELLGGIIAVGLGILLYQIKQLAFPDFNDAQIMSFLPDILQSLFENSRNMDANPYTPLTMLLTSFIDFPGILAWFIPAIYVSYVRNKQFSNIKKRRVGWDVFWKGAYMIEILLALVAFGLGIATLMGNQGLISYFAGGLIFIIFLFITPYFYLAIGIAGLGGFLGTRLALGKPGDSEVTFTEEYLAEGDDYVGTSDYDEYAEYEEDEYEEYEDTDRTEIVDFDSQGEVVGMVCKYCWETYPVGTDSCGKCGNTDVSQAIECSNCGNMIPIDAKFCNECGNQM